MAADGPAAVVGAANAIGRDARVKAATECPVLLHNRHNCAVVHRQGMVLCCPFHGIAQCSMEIDIVAVAEVGTFVVEIAAGIDVEALEGP